MNAVGGVGFSQEYDHDAPTLVESCSCLNGRRTATSFNRNQGEAAKLIVCKHNYNPHHNLIEGVSER